MEFICHWLDIETDREINGEQQSSDGSSLCRFATDSMMMMARHIDGENHQYIGKATFVLY